MDKIFFGSLTVVGIIGALLALIPEQKLKKGVKITLFIGILMCLVFQGYYGLSEKKKEDYRNFLEGLYQDAMLRKTNQLSEDFREFKEKEKKGTLTSDDYNRYIVHYLEMINLTLKRFDWKNTREWVTTYYDEVDKIPSYFTLQEWKESEKFIYNSMIKEINGNFASRNIYNSSIRQGVLKTFNTERKRLLDAKEREFNK